MVAVDRRTSGAQIEDETIELKGATRATGNCYLELRSAVQKMKWMGTGYYDDEYVREDGQWKILHRVDHPMMPTAAEWAKEMAARRAK